MLLIESFEEATDLILEGIDSGDIHLIIEGSKRFKEAVKTYKELIDKTREQFASAPVLSQTIEEFLKEIQNGIKTLEQGSDERGFEVTSKWSNLLKLKSPWEAGKSNMAELSMFAAKLDILSRGMLEAVKMVIKMVRNYEGIFIVNNEGVAIKPDSQVNPELKLSDIAGLEGKELIEKLISPKAGESSEPADDEQEENVNAESIRFNDDLLLTELLGMGGASNDELAMVYKSFPNLCDEIDGDKLKQAKELYGYFKKLADDTETLFEEITKMLVKLEPTSELQNLVKQSDSSWIKKLFTTPKYKINKEEAKKLAGKKGILSVKMSEFSTIVQNLVSGMKKNAPVETLKDTEEEARTEENDANDQIENSKDLNQASQDVEDLADETGVPSDTLTNVLHQTEGETDTNITADVLEDEGVDPEQAKDVAKEMEEAIDDDGGSSKPSKPFKAKKIDKNSLKSLFDDVFKKGEGAPFNSAQKNILNFALRRMELVTEVYNYGNSEEDVIADLIDAVKKLKPEDCGISKKNIPKWKKNQKSLVDKLQDKDKIDSMASFIQKELDYPFGEIPEGSDDEAAEESSETTGTSDGSDSDDNEESKTPFEVLYDIETLDDKTKEEWLSVAEEEGVLDSAGDAVKGTTKEKASEVVELIDDDISDNEEEELEDSMVIDESFARWQRLAGILKD